MVFVELPKFSKNLQALANLTDQWIYFFKDAPSLDIIPTELREIPEIENAFNRANQANLTEKELDKIHRQEIFIEDQRGYIIKARQERYLEAFAQGKIEECLALVLRVLERKFTDIPAATIAEINTLSLAKLELLIFAILDFNSLTDLSSWLQDNTASD